MKNGSASGCITHKNFFRTTKALGCVLTIMLCLSTATPAIAKSEIRALRQEIKELREQNEQLQAVIDQSQTQQEEEKGKHSSKQHQKELKEGSKALEYNKKIRELEAFNKQLSGAVAELERQNKALLEAQAEQAKLMGQAQAENQKLKSETSEQEKLHQALQALTKENESLKNELGASQQRYAELETQKNAANAEQVGQLQQNLSETQAENQKLKESVSDQQKLQQALQAQMKENESLKAALAAQEQKYAELEIQKNTANSELLGKQQQSLTELQTENRKLAQALAEMTTKVVDLEKQQGEGQKGALEAQEMARQLEELNKKYAALQQENLSLVGTAKQASPEKMQELIEQNKSLRETIRAQNDAILANDGASKQLMALREENEELRQALSGAKQHNPEEQETIKQLRLEIAALQNEINERTEQQAGIEELKQTVLALQEQNSQLLQSQSALHTASAPNGEVKGDALGMAQVLQTQIEKEKAVNSEYRQKIKEYQDQIARLQGQDQGTAQPAAVSAVPAELAYDETVRALMIQNQELKARIELMELGAKKKTKTKKASQEKTSAISQGDPATQHLQALKVTEGSALPQVQKMEALQAEERTISATELLEVEPMTKNVQLIRKNHTVLPEMPPAQQIGGDSESDGAEGSKQKTTVQAQQESLPEIQPAAGAENSLKLKDSSRNNKALKDKDNGHTNG